MLYMITHMMAFWNYFDRGTQAQMALCLLTIWTMKELHWGVAQVYLAIKQCSLSRAGYLIVKAQQLPGTLPLKWLEIKKTQVGCHF